MHTKEKDVFFVNAVKVFLAPTPQEGPYHMMFVGKQHTQEPKEPKVCDWNHLSLSVLVSAKLASRRDHGLELTQSHSAAQTKTCKHDRQHATKVTSALTDTCIQFPGPVMSTFGKDIMFVLGSYDKFLTVWYRPFSPSFVTMSSSGDDCAGFCSEVLQKGTSTGIEL